MPFSEKPMAMNSPTNSSAAVPVSTDRQRVDRAADAVDQAQGRGDEEKLVDPIVSQLVELHVLQQVPAEIANDPQVQREWLTRRQRERLDRGVVRADRAEIVLLEPANHVGARPGRARVEEIGIFGEDPKPAGADQDDVARLYRDALSSGTIVQLGRRNRVIFCQVRNAALAGDVEQDAATDDRADVLDPV